MPTRIDSRTGLLGIIGDPVEHSLSPRMHNFLLERAGLNFCYLAFRVDKEGFQGALEGMRALGIRGLNVTAPHKERVLPYLDGLSAEARALGAVNTVLNDGGRLIGYNTDPYGFSESLRAQGVSPEGWNVVILGAGGGAAAAAWALIELGAAKIAIYGRTRARAEALASRLAGVRGSASLEAHGLADPGLKDQLARAQLLVHATPVGTFPHTDEIVIKPELLHDSLVVYDLVYNPPKTRLLREAEARGARAINGLEMLIHQGLKSFEIWTGVKPAPEVANELKAYLQEEGYG